MKELENFKEKILQDYKRCSIDDKFEFSCHPGISCFNNCCSDVNIFLTPLDIIRLKNRLGISSEEFLDKYTLLPFDVNQSHPVILLKMESDKNKSCPFVSEKGCTVYEDRPWPCRMYPLGKASATEKHNGNGDNFYFILHEDVCNGFNEKKEWSIKSWMESQEVYEYDQIGELFKEVSMHKFFLLGKQLNPQKIEMFHLVCYNIDKFREFVFHSSFMKRFELPATLLDKIKTDEIELLKFGFDWLKFSLFEEKIDYIKIRKQ
ncbi:MAG: putative Fe-S oxidoreductase [Ignavibacteria bacterium]|nr:putative Fe-S oxidoreductase [Ignavibacteria bacterium]